jgi:hypothetical protein
MRSQRLSKIKTLYKIALELEDNDIIPLEEQEQEQEEESEESEEPGEEEESPSGILSMFESAGSTILNKIKKIASWTPFAAEALSLYFYVLDTGPNIIFRAAVAAFLMAVTGVITAEVASSFIAGLSAIATGGLAAPFAAAAEVLMKGVGAGSLVASIPFAIAIYNLLVKDKHLTQAKEFLKSANIKIEHTAITKAARELAIQGDYNASSTLIKVAMGRKD